MMRLWMKGSVQRDSVTMTSYQRVENSKLGLARKSCGVNESHTTMTMGNNRNTTEANPMRR